MQGPTSERKRAAAQSTDEELLDGARRGDDSAFRLLVERYEGRVAATVIGMLGNGEEAEDAGQETFIRFYRSLGKFRGESSIGTYLTRIAINQSLDAIKRRQRWTKRFVSRDEEEVMLAEPPHDVREEISARERAEFVRGAIRMLKPDHRAVVVLRMIEGYSTRETAEILGLPVGTVTSRLSRALDKLETVLGPLVAEA
ncbi:MAG: RNA polymerase sigma factor [Gemmatimonadetes bacterium]|nr:RNA polymerase sigma factor [Gemmatimonadota bacterium]